MKPRRYSRSDTVIAPRERELDALKRSDAMVALFNARIASHADEGLADWLRAVIAPTCPATDRAYLLSRISGLRYGADVMAACREALCL